MNLQRDTGHSATNAGTTTPRELFSPLNSDIFINVMRFLQPPEIIVVRKTCKTLYSASHRRIVWLDALNRVMEEHGLFKPTYHLDSMTDSQLEQAALFPWKFSFMVNTSNGVPLRPRAHRILVNSLMNDDTERIEQAQREDGRDFATIMLVPGGRFLLTTSDAYSVGSYVKLWDLGQPGTRLLPVLVATTVLESHCVVYATAPTQDGLGIRIVSTFDAENQMQADPYKIKVHEIFPVSPSPVFREIGAIKVRRHLTCLSICGDRIIFTIFGIALRPSFVVVWDFVRHLTSTFRPYFGAPTEVQIHDKYAILGLAKSLSIWEIPPLQPPAVDDADDATAEEKLPILEFLLPFVKTSSTELPPHDLAWSSDSPNRRLLVALGFFDTPHVSFDVGLYKMEDSPPPHNPALPTSVPVVLTRGSFNHTLEVQGDLVRYKPHFCGNNVILACSVRDFVWLFMLPIPEARESRSSSPTSCMLKIGKCQPAQMEIAPATGRVCTITIDGEIRVIDYLLLDTGKV
ncbi:hypothetical protein BDZ97DRAFT_1842780 [Flammula alnicola]|nr:hypothetical protein BDZ97DRAFT_1842780 [Flammula alnicola]